MPVVEIASWTASDAFVADKSIIKPGLDFLKKVNGCNTVYSGFAEEENTYFLLIVWETLQHHKDLVAHPEYPQVLGFGPTIGKGGIKLYHVEFENSIIPAVSAPVTEVLAISLKEGLTKDDLYAIFDTLAPKINAANKEEYRPVTWGPTLEDPRTFYLTVGWESAAFHREVVGRSPIKGLVAELETTGEFNLVHIDFAKHT